MSTTTTRRDVVKLATGLVIGAGLAGGTAPVEATHPDRAALLAWEDALADAGTRGESWVKDAKQLCFCVQLAVWQAQETGALALLASLQTALAEADAIHKGRSATFQSWADVAWNLPDLAPLPSEPWG